MEPTSSPLACPSQKSNASCCFPNSFATFARLRQDIHLKSRAITSPSDGGVGGPIQEHALLWLVQHYNPDAETRKERYAKARPQPLCELRWASGKTDSRGRLEVIGSGQGNHEQHGKVGHPTIVPLLEGCLSDLGDRPTYSGTVETVDAHPGDGPLSACRMCRWALAVIVCCCFSWPVGSRGCLLLRFGASVRSATLVILRGVLAAPFPCLAKLGRG
jgi:hypothetical protein